MGVGDTLQIRPDTDVWFLAALLHEIDETVGQNQIEGDVTVPLEERGEHRNDQHAPEVARSGDANRAARLCRASLERGDRDVERIDRVDHGIVETHALGGWAHRAAAAVEELGAELLFEPGQAPADRRLRNAEMPRGRGEAVPPNDLDERCNIVSIWFQQPI